LELNWEHKRDTGEKGDDGVVDPSTLQPLAPPMVDSDLVLVVRSGTLGTLSASDAKEYFRAD
jgi:hypothetical protein